MTQPAEAQPAALGAGRRGHWFITGLGIGQIVSWGSFYYSFPVIAEPMGRELGLAKPAIYAAATFGLAVAGLAAYPVGAWIDRGGGRAVMTLGSTAGGLLLIAWSQVEALWSFYVLFAGIGLVQAMTLYEPAFAVVARRFGVQARRGITLLTLWGGFASTVFVPLVQLLLDRFGWRDGLIVLGLINLVLCVALYALTIDPRADAAAVTTLPPGPTQPSRGVVRRMARRPAFWGLLVSFTLFQGMHSALIFHLYPLLLEQGYSAGAAVAAIAVFGPAQVFARIVVWLFAGRLSVRAIGMVNVLLFPVGLALLSLGGGSAFAALFVYGAANGIMTIVRGLAVPEMLTREAYGALNGVLAAPIAVARALAPLAAAQLWALSGSYEGVLAAALIACGVLAAAFWFAALQPVRPGA